MNDELLNQNIVDDGQDQNIQESEEMQETQDQEQEIEADEPDKSQQQKQGKPLHERYIAEKAKRKDLEKRIRELESKTISYENQNKLEKIKNMVKEKGFDDEVADLFTKIGNELLESIPKVDKVEQEILEDIEDYADENPEALKHKKQIIETVKKYRKADPDFSVEDALNLIKPTKLRYNELKTDIEQKQAIARRNAEAKKVASSSSSSPSNPYPLDEADKKALAELKKAQPDKNWTEEKFFKIMKT